MANTTARNTDVRPGKPSGGFRMSEGTRQQLEMYGYAVSPFNGAMLVGTGVDNVREATEAEYMAAVKAHKQKENEKKDSTLL